ncbi:MFS transporter [Streptomyces sp. NPDC001820]|uniref:MFS transporter n=1 Tax=Streptomyces sp. NPDC001820 TaxID=3364613 RepID=UPI0036C5E882
MPDSASPAQPTPAEACGGSVPHPAPSRNRGSAPDPAPQTPARLEFAEGTARTGGPPRPEEGLGGGKKPRKAGPLAPYRQLFAPPGAPAFTAGNLLARLPMGMFSVSAVIMIAGSRGSYALAGAVTATGLAVTALVAPWTARLVDRHGQARIAVPATALAALGSLALLLCVHYDAPDWTLFAAYAATATTPNTGGMSRARWAHLHRGDPAALHTANSFEQAADELCFMLGPVLAAFLCAALFPEAGTLTGSALMLTGVLIFAAQRSTEPPVTPRPAGTRSPLRTAGMAPLLAVFLATGAVFGALEISTLAYLDGPMAGLLLALQAAGSCLAGLLYGATGPARSLPGRLAGCLAAMTALMTLPLLAARTGSAALLAVALLLAGAATAPTMVTGMTQVQRLTPQNSLNEGMTLAVTAILAGIAAGSATAGWAVESLSAAHGYVVPASAAGLALVVALAAAGTTKARLS